MKVIPIRTHLIKPHEDLVQLVTTYLPDLPERSVIAIASKAFSFAENRLVPKTTEDKQEKWDLVKKEAEYYLDPNDSEFQLMFTIKGNWLFVNAGIDESNSAGHFTLWPADPQASLNTLWLALHDHYGLKEFGLIMTDSRTFPLNWGVVGHGIAHAGFAALNSYIGTPDLHGRLLKMEQVNVIQSLAAAAAFEMGEGNERQPLALITDIQQRITFQDHPPTPEEIAAIKIGLKDDLYAPFITAVPWKKGDQNQS